MESKPNPLGKLLSGALEPYLMCHTKNAVVRGKGSLVTQVKCHIWPRVKPTLQWRVKSRARVLELGSSVGVGLWIWARVSSSLMDL